MGVIADTARRTVPLTWDALSGDARFGELPALQEVVEDVKDEVLGTTAPAEASEGTLSRVLRRYLAKKVVLALIPPGIEYWSRMPITVTTTGTNEVEGYPDPVQALERLRVALMEEIARMEPDIGVVPVTRRTMRPRVSDGERDEMVTANPHEFPPAFQRPGVTTSPTLG